MAHQPSARSTITSKLDKWSAAGTLRGKGQIEARRSADKQKSAVYPDVERAFRAFMRRSYSMPLWVGM